MDQAQRSESVSAVKWALLDKFGAQLILLINTLVLARALSPKDFGLISILYIFLSISSAFVDSGMGGGLIRKQDLTDTDCSTFFFFNIFIAVICYGLLFAAAPYIADFYHEPTLVMLLRILSITIFINSLGLIQKVLLIKRLKFKYVTRSSLIASFVSTMVALICAWKGMGVWSLLILQVVQSTGNTLLLWFFCKWWPSLVFSKVSFKELYAFGFSLLLTALVNIGFANIYQPLIGKYFSVTYSGFYYQAKRLYEVPILTISQVVDSVTFPILVKYQHNRQELAKNYRSIVMLLIFISLPVVITISFLSEDIVVVLLGKKWLFTADLLRILSFAGVFQILETINGSLFKIEGRTKLILRLELVKKAIIIINILIFCQWGIKPLMYGMVINSVLSFALNQYFISIRMLNYSKLLVMAVNGFLMGVAIFMSNYYITNHYIALVVGGCCGGLIYLLSGYIEQIPEQKQLFNMFLKKINPAY